MQHRFDVYSFAVVVSLMLLFYQMPTSSESKWTLWWQLSLPQVMGIGVVAMAAVVLFLKWRSSMEKT